MAKWIVAKPPQGLDSSMARVRQLPTKPEARASQGVLYGSLDIGRDQQGIAEARRLRDLLDRIVGALEAGPLPATAPVAAVPKTVRNPFD